MEEQNNEVNYETVTTTLVTTTQIIEREWQFAPNDVPDWFYESMASNFKGQFLDSFINTVLDKIVTLNPSLNKTELHILIYFMTIVQKDGTLIINLNMLGDTLKTTNRRISMALNRLIKKNIVLRKGKKFSYEYSLTSNLSNE